MKINAENDEYQIITSLKNNRSKRNKSQEVFVEGIDCIKQAIKADTEITRLIIKDRAALSDWGKETLRQYGGTKIIELPEGLYNKLSDRENPSEMLITARITHHSLESINPDNPFIIVFDRPSDHGNLGSVIRSANAFGADGLFITGHGVDAYESKVIRASLGSIFFTRIVIVESMEKLEAYIKVQKEKTNMEVIGTDSDGEAPLGDHKLKRPIMMILGNEAKGISVRLKALCDRIIRIPMEGNVNSLNVSCAASIAMWEVYKSLIPPRP